MAMVFRGLPIGVACLAAAAGMIPTPCPADGDRVRVSIDVQGTLMAPAGQETVVRQPITVAGRFEFWEHPSEPDSATVSRSFSEATATITVDGIRHASTLGSDLGRILVTRQGTAAVPFVADTFLTRQERDLLDIPFDPLLTDGLLAEAAVAVGATWKVPADIAAGLLAIDTIEAGSLEATLEGIDELRARVVFSGIVDGAVDGVPTHLVIDGTCTVPAAPDISSDETSLRFRLDGRPSQVEVTLRERRQASHVAAGFEVEARVAATRTPHDAPPPDDGQSAATRRRGGRGGPDLLWHRDGEGRFDLVHDVRWREVEQDGGVLLLRYVDLGALVAQCSITALPPAGTLPPTVEEVQRDIRRSLVGQFERFEEASAEVREDGVTVIRIASAGTAESLPFRWVHYVLADDSGRRASAAFMMEAAMEERLGPADRALVAGLRLDAPGSAGSAAAREARLPGKTATP
jgi:hypothetical protein